MQPKLGRGKEERISFLSPKTKKTVFITDSLFYFENR